MNKGKKTDLFRFITMRSPELISKDRVDLGFIYHPDPTNSHFIEVVHSMDDVDAGRIILDNKADSYVTSHTPETLKELDASFWEFSDWLVKNKMNLSRATVDAKMVSLPGTSKIIKIWDNLFYDVLRKKNPNIRETCLQLIIAINFAQKYTTYAAVGTTDADILAKEAKDLLRLAEGKVVLHQSFTVAKDTSYGPTPYARMYDYRRHEALHLAAIAGMKVEEYKEMKKSFLALEKTYETEFKAAFNSQLTPYKLQVRNAVSSYFSRNPGAEQEAKINVEKSIKAIKATKGGSTELTKSVARFETSLESVIPPGTVESFDFDFSDPLVKSYTAGKLSKIEETFVAERSIEGASIKTAIKALEKEIKGHKKYANRRFKSKPTEILVNGIPVKSNPLGLKDITLSFYEIAGGTGASHGLYFSMETGYNKAFIKTANFSLKIGPDTYATTDVNMLANGSTFIFASLFESAGITSIPNDAMISFTGTLELSNGQLYTFDIDGPAASKLISGSAVPTKSLIANEDLHYGVNKIGVADYRRVEQELCCYVPGEVAHIENVMAREYKERTTRNLVRSQTSSSFEQENEKEESLDTTATARNEMSSEVSAVIDEEQNTSAGFNASVSGEKLDIRTSAGVSGDFSTGKSSSDSNSAARTMAEDLTKRALERITSKISVKRTSKLVQEFEEKNSHGLDNRAGDKHVTGVYRWIDKLYKNRIVNYGKRLMYEFMVPEPSRFYKQALIVKAEETQPRPRLISTNEEDLLIRPTHPSQIEVANAGSLNRSNYNSVAAEYGIDVTAPPEQFANLTISFAEAIGSGDDWMSFSYDTLRVEPDYECFKVAGEIDYSYRSHEVARGFIKCNLAGESFCSPELHGESRTGKLAIALHPDRIEGTFPIAVNTKKITAYAGSIVAECELKLSVYEEWQQIVYKEIMNAYEEQMSAYKLAEQLAKDEKEREKALKNAKDANKPVDQKMVTNSKFNKQRVQTELKRLCIEMLTKPFGITMGSDFYQNGAHNIPEVKLGSSLDLYASHVKFFEQAFDWEIMAERFYPYYWADRSDWKSLFQTQDGNDYSFQAFLQSGMGRVIVPVRQGFEDAVTYFMETGEVWNGSGIVIDTTDKLYLSIVDETTNIEGTVEGQEWETVVPTTLKILQGKSVLLDEEGLPCCESGHSDSNFLPDINVLNANPPATDPAP